jgi:ribosomal protein S27AE
MSAFYICLKCGYPPINHNFRHTFVGTKVTKITTDQFILDALEFPTVSKSKCSVDSCNAVIGIHNTPVLEHKYLPIYYNFRMIRLVIPLNSHCSKCGSFLNSHQDKDHFFTAKVNVENKGVNDIITLIHPQDEDIQILCDESI